MRVVAILAVLAGAFFLLVARWLGPFTPVDLRTDYKPYIMEIAEPTDSEGSQEPAHTVD